MDQIPPNLSLFLARVAFMLAFWFCAVVFISCKSLFLRKASSALSLLSSSSLGFDVITLMSDSRHLMVNEVFCHNLFVWFFAIFWMSSLKISHSVWGFVTFLVVSLLVSFSSSSWMVQPCLATFSISAGSDRDWRGQVQQPLSMLGMSFGAYFTVTIQWSVGIAVGLAFHPKMVCMCFLTVYIVFYLASIVSIHLCIQLYK